VLHKCPALWHDSCFFESPEDSHMSTASKKLLLATRDAVFLDLAASCLHRAGFEPHLADTLDDAFRLASGQSWHLVVLDSALGSSRLVALLAGLRATGSRVPLVVYTHGDPGLAERVMASGATAVWQEWPAAACLPAIIKCLAAAEPRAGTLAEILGVAQPLWVELRDPACSGSFPSTLLAVRASALLIAAPLAAGLPLPVSAGAEINVGFGRPEGWYQFASEVIANTFHLRTACLLITQPQMLSHLERRRHGRVETSGPCRFHVNGTEHAAALRDISRSGLQAVVQAPLPLGTVVLWDAESIQARARCVWLRPIPEGHLVGVAFEQPPEAQTLGRLAGTEGGLP